jgi:hypothetical protein
MTGPIPAPEIINPYGLDSIDSEETSFIEDLGLDRLIDSVPFENFSQVEHLAYEVMGKLDTDAETVSFRQDVFEDLITHPALRQGIQKVLENMSEVHGSLWYHRNDLSSEMELLKEYTILMENLPDFKGVQSTGLLEVGNYLGGIRASEEYRELARFVFDMENLRGVDLRISLDGIEDSGDLAFVKTMVGKDSKGEQPLEKLLGRENPGKSKRSDLGWRVGESMDFLLTKFKNDFLIPIAQAYTPQIEEVTSLLRPLDFYFGFAEYFVQLKENGFDVSRPTLLPKRERRMMVKNARNPLLMRDGEDGGEVVPNDIEYDAKNNLFVITGPNNGGKTTYVKTTGLIQRMAERGFFVPAESAEISFTDGMYTHFVAPDDITKGEGRYRNELRRMKEIFERATPFSMVILDEPCGGTSYEEGQRQSLAFLEGLHRLGSATYFTTHMHPLTREIDNGRFSAGRNLQVECIDNGKTIQYTYKVVPGSSGKSYGEEIAREVGLREEDIRDLVSEGAKKGRYKTLLR